MLLMAIDPGNNESAIVTYDVSAKRPTAHAKLSNRDARERVRGARVLSVDAIAVEMIASYGMPVGREIFETVLWIGRFAECAEVIGVPLFLVYRKDVKLHLCGQTRATDANIRQALIDLYGPDRASAVGTSKAPGPLFGITRDRWSALAVARTVADTRLQTGLAK